MAKVTILKVGHALVAGERGAKEGGAPSKDSIWGIAQVDNVLLTFSGRRNATTLKFKTRLKGDLEKTLALFDQKLAGTDVKGIKYTDIQGVVVQEMLIPGLAERVGKGYYQATFSKKLDTRSTKAKAKVAKVVVTA